MSTNWTDDEIMNLIKLHNDEIGKNEISQILNKPINAVKYKIKILTTQGVISLKFKRCYICKGKMSPTERFSKCQECYKKEKSSLTGKLLINI